MFQSVRLYVKINEQNQAIRAAERKYLIAQEKNEVYFQTLNKKVINNAKNNNICRLDADGLHYWNNANRGSGNP